MSLTPNGTAQKPNTQKSCRSHDGQSSQWGEGWGRTLLVLTCCVCVSRASQANFLTLAGQNPLEMMKKHWQINGPQGCQVLLPLTAHLWRFLRVDMMMTSPRTHICLLEQEEMTVRGKNNDKSWHSKEIHKLLLFIQLVFPFFLFLARSKYWVHESRAWLSPTCVRSIPTTMR